MYKKNIFIIVAAVLIFAGFICAYHGEKNCKIIISIPELHNGDAKFYKNNIVTSIDGILTIYNEDGDLVKSYHEIAANWINCIQEENIIVYGNLNYQIGILKLDDAFNIVSNEILMMKENLQIDPTIVKVEDAYYITATEIVGNVNNSHINAEKGNYTLRLYKSDNLSNWKLVSNIIDTKYNIEDIDIFYKDRKFYVIYEKEIVDKGYSSINVVISDDNSGRVFTETHELLPADCDREPASIEVIDGGYRLFYSCDKNYPGESYMGGQIFYAEYDENWDPLIIDEVVDTETKKGILLYDINNCNGKQQFLFAKEVCYIKLKRPPIYIP